MKSLFAAIVFFACVYNALGQAELKKIAPLSPDAAAIAKFGEMPTGTFTGIAPIDVPLYTVAGKEMSLPLSLSYHAGGNKVEDVASWVGLGWSLGSLPSISRNTRGLEDDAAGGYFSLYNGQTVKEIYDDRGTTGGAVTYNAFLEDVRSGAADAEPDIFSFSLLGKSGKFYYRQTDSTFYTIPFYNVKINRITNGFRITDDDGTIYDFNEPEASTNNLNSATNSWWATKIVNANRTDSITIEYTSQIESFNTTAHVEKNIYVSGDASCAFTPNSTSSVSTVSTSIKPDRINFRGGYVRFFPQATTRQDLSGGKALDRIEVYNYLDQLIKKIKFQYTYHNSGCTDSPDCYRLVLDRFWEETQAGHQSTPYIFTYNTSVGVPHRQSTGQDYWGYNNGQSGNADLVPDIIYQLSGNPKKLPGANRDVSTVDVQFSMLTKITYPTGGSIEYEYENNWVDEPSLPIKTKDTSVLLSGTGAASSHEVYQKTLVIDVPAYPYLNGDNGGAFVDISIANLGCDISGGANLCANITITGVSNSFNSGSILSNITGMYLPNGTYTMQAEFYQDPPLYGSYMFGVSWKKADSLYADMRLAGGVRVKKVTVYDGVSHSNDIVRKFVYTKSATDSSSSGKVFGIPYFNYGEYFNLHHRQPAPSNPSVCASCDVQLFKRSTSSNITAVSHSGSFVGYERVLVEIGNGAASGRMEYRFSNEKDIVPAFFPYPPASSNEHLRGLPLESTNFKKTGSNYFPVTRTKGTFSDHLTSTTTAFALKVAAKDQVVNECGSFYPPPTLEVASYELASNKVLPTVNHSYFFNSDDSAKVLEQSSTPEYSSKYFQNKVTMISSEGDTLETFTTYPDDVTLSGIAETARQALVTQNRIAVPLQVIKKNNSVQTQIFQNNYKEFTTGKVFENTIEYARAANTKEVRVQFNKFDSAGNLLEQQKAGDVQEVYLWGYRGMYPVAKVLNTTYDVAITYVTQSVLDNPASDASLQTHLNNLRSIPGAMVTTYTYKPLVGLTSETDAAGRTTFYEYDFFNRLSVVRDQDGYVRKKICYNYAGQPEYCNVFYNVVKSDSFTRNNCATGYIGSTVTYTVPAGTYSAFTQAVADSLAQNDVDSNGQAYANANGTCTVECTTSNCSGANKKCINNVCETGVKVYTSSVQLGLHHWLCTYHYEWSDGSWSQNYTEEPTTQCLIES